MESNEPDISLDFHVVFSLGRAKMIMSFVESKVGFHLTWLKCKKRRKENKIILHL